MWVVGGPEVSGGDGGYSHIKHVCNLLEQGEASLLGKGALIEWTLGLGAKFGSIIVLCACLCVFAFPLWWHCTVRGNGGHRLALGMWLQCHTHTHTHTHTHIYIYINIYI